MSGRAWVKLYCDNWFSGSIRKETPELRSIWTDLLAFAGRTGDKGVIALPGTNVGYTDNQLAEIFNVPVELWMICKQRLSNHPGGEDEDRIYVSESNVITILHWDEYQSEYDKRREKDRHLVSRSERARICRQRLKSRDDVSTEVCPPTPPTDANTVGTGENVSTDTENANVKVNVKTNVSLNSNLCPPPESELSDRNDSPNTDVPTSVSTEEMTVGNRGGRIEENRIEKIRKILDQDQDQERCAISRKGRSKFTPPTLDEVQKYCDEHGYKIDPVHFLAHHSARGWISGRTPIRNWKAAVVTWVKNERAYGGRV